MKRKRIIAILTIIAIVLIPNYNSKNKAVAANLIMDNSGVYIITNDKKMEMQFADVFEDSATSVVIPATIEVNGYVYKVTSIKAKALMGNKKIKKMTIGENVKNIGKKAFCGCKNLKSITIKTTKLTSSSVKSGAFKGLNTKAVVTVPKSKLAAYKRILKAKGLTKKNQKVVAKQEEKKEEEVPEVTFGPDHPLPAPEEAIASIGNIARVATKDFDTAKVSDTAKYAKGDSILFSVRVCMPPEIYGQYCTRDSYGMWIRCFTCNRKFGSEQEYALHQSMSPGCDFHFEAPDGYKEAYTESYWAADYTPCKTVFHATIPEGLSCQKDSIKLLRSKNIEIDKDVYHVDISGQDLTVTIDDIKAMPYFSYSFETSDYGGFRYPISLMFNAEVNDAATVTNTVSTSVSYSYKGLEKTVDLGNLNVYTATLQFKNTDTSGNIINGSKFTLYKQKIVYNSANIGTPQYFEVAESESIDGLLTFNGIGEGKYKLVQTEVPEGYKKINSLIFDVSMKCENGSISSLSVKDKHGKKLPWDINIETGVINTTIVNN